MSGKVCDFAKSHEWTQEHYALNIEGKTCSPEGASAVSFCAMGFIRGAHYRESITDYHGRYAAEEALVNYLRDSGQLKDYESIPSWNDAPERTREQVIEAICGAGI